MIHLLLRIEIVKFGQLEAGQVDMTTYVIEVSDFNFSSDLTSETVLRL